MKRHNHHHCHGFGHGHGHGHGHCHHGQQPVVCPTQYQFNDCYVEREVPVIHPIVTVNRKHIVNVPRHYYTQSTENVVVDPGDPGRPGHCNMNKPCHKPFHGLFRNC
ncbi:hypothetical protein MHH85_01165 [Viridibacillus sp. FSL E2-0187]|uniref:hypothetical protein n=1 Tax=Viridibacillus sp. FSL E2-0187 TaxID=2921362 RepID=UPI0030F7CB04